MKVQTFVGPYFNFKAVKSAIYMLCCGPCVETLMLIPPLTIPSFRTPGITDLTATIIRPFIDVDPIDEWGAAGAPD